MIDKQNGGNLRLFLGCFISLIATAFGFIVRASLLGEWRADLNLSNEQVGYIFPGAAIFPFAISIILFSLFIDQLGYGRAMVFAFVAHFVSTIMTIFADSFIMLYAATFLYALGNGTVEAVINPVVATTYHKNKTHWLNILHAGWPGGLVLGGLLAIGIGWLPSSLWGGFDLWRVKMCILLIPTVIYGILLIGVKFPKQERVAAGVSYLEMLKEFGWGSCYIVSFLLLAGVKQVLLALPGNIGGAFAAYLPMEVLAVAALAPTVLFALFVRSFGRPMFVFLLLVMFLLATTELGTDGWISDIMTAVLGSSDLGTGFLIYTSAIMFVLRFFAGPIVHRISPLGLLAASAALATFGLLFMANAGNSLWLLLAAATIYGFGKTFFWPTTLGVVSEQYPKGGALMLNAIAGVGMLAVGTIGGTAIGTLQDRNFDQALATKDAPLHKEIMVEERGLFGVYNKVDSEKAKELTEEQSKEIEGLTIAAKQGTLQQVAVLPAIMFVCYIGLIVYFMGRGGYKAEVLTGHKADDEKFTGGVEGPVE